MSFNNQIGVRVPEVLIPNENVDLNKWSVVACDQYTSQPEYWEDVYNYVGDSPSTLNIIFPEVYLNDSNAKERINSINTYMDKYLSSGILRNIGPCFVYLERQYADGNVRKGLVLAIDLEEYNFEKDSKALIRASEGTVIDRIPPRLEIRKDAEIESPHVMLLIDDPDMNIIEPLAEVTQSYEPLYDFDLMLNSGHIKGYKIDDPEIIKSIINKLSDLADAEKFKEKYNLKETEAPLLFAVGDGNHSLATAKCHWDNIKEGLSNEDKLTHPARYALVEVVNIHDSGIVFEPIHRVLFNVDTKDLLENMKSYFIDRNCDIEFTIFDSLSKACNLANEKRKHDDNNVQYIVFTTKNDCGVIMIKNSPNTLEVGTLQDFLDEYMKNGNSNVEIDYIHGDDVLENLSKRDKSIGFMLPVMNKNNFFKAIVNQGVLPRKTFSMGDADNKRFYLECKMIKKK